MDKKLLYTIGSYINIGIGAFALTKLYNEYQSNKMEKKSNFAGDRNKIISFTLNNTSSSNKRQQLFNVNGTYGSPLAGGLAVSNNLKLFDREILSNPKRINKIQFRSANSFQTEMPFTIEYNDASGDNKLTTYTPLVSPNQFQGGITEVNMNSLLLDGTKFMNYTILPKTSVNVVVFYDDLSLSDALKENANGKNYTKKQELRKIVKDATDRGIASPVVLKKWEEEKNKKEKELGLKKVTKNKLQKNIIPIVVTLIGVGILIKINK